MRTIKILLLLVLTVLAFCLISLAPVSLRAADVTFTIGNGSGFPGTHPNQIAVSMDNPTDRVRSLQMDVTDVSDDLICTGCEPDTVRAPQFNCIAQEQSDGECRVVLFHIGPSSQAIEAGTGTIFTIDYAVHESTPAGECRELALGEAKISDPDVNPLEASSVSGQFCFNVCVADSECDGDGCTNGTCESGQCVYACNALGADDPCCVYPLCGSYPLCIDPLDADHDGVPDNGDNCPNIYNADQTNSDSDSRGDSCDNCPTVTNEDQADADANGIGDACDYRLLCGDVWPRESVPGAMDCGNGTIDIFDIVEMVDRLLSSEGPSSCQLARGDVPSGVPPYCGTPPGGTNCEGSGTVDVFDLLVIIDTILDKSNCINYCLCGIDADADGISNSEDNCPTVSNADQTNSDSDSHGDACDNCPITPNEDQSDNYPPYGNNCGDVCECHADCSIDQKVDLADLVIMKQQFLWSCDQDASCEADCNYDHSVNLADLAMLKGEFMRTDCPLCQ